jgi:hypothetical protein
VDNNSLIFSVIQLRWKTSDYVALTKWHWEVKGNVQPTTCHEGTEGQWMHRSTLAFTTALDGVGCHQQAPGALSPGKGPGTHCLWISGAPQPLRYWQSKAWILGEKCNPTSAPKQTSRGTYTESGLQRSESCNHPPKPWHVEHHINIFLKAKGLVDCH